MLTSKECWTARRVSSSWACAARQTACFEVVLPVHAKKMLSQVKVLSKRQHRHLYPNISFTMKLTEPLQMTELASLMQQLGSEVN